MRGRTRLRNSEEQEGRVRERARVIGSVTKDFSLANTEIIKGCRQKRS
jgi:hypothetical protein